MNQQEPKRATIELDDLIEVSLRGVQRATEARRLAATDLKNDDLIDALRIPPMTLGIIFWPQDPNFPTDMFTTRPLKQQE